MTNTSRIDDLLVTNGFAGSGDAARAMVMAGVVLVGDKRVEKPSEQFATDAAIRIKGDSPESKYVSRGGLKLEKALSEFHIHVSEYVCLDVGSSTGGFTDCLLKHGAARVVAVDAGTNQLDWKLRSDPRVEVHENTNARDINTDDVGGPFDLIAMDVSFISSRKILPALVTLLKPSSPMVVLIKPQFEVARHEVGEGGIVKDPALHERVVREVNDFAEANGFRLLQTINRQS